MKFRSKPAEIEAQQWFPGHVLIGVFVDSQGSYVVTIGNQKVYLNDGDWVIREPDGVHYYPCKDSVFKSRWEAAL